MCVALQGGTGGKSDFVALEIKTLAGFVLIVPPSQHGYEESDCLPPPPATAGWFMVAVGLPVFGKRFCYMRCSWCPALSVMHCPAEKGGYCGATASWLRNWGFSAPLQYAASAPLHRGVLWLGFCFSWA